MEQYLENIFCGIDDSIHLDEEQKKAIVEDSDYVLLVAGAGSGKTTTMAAKVKYLVDIKNIKPEEILVISFTNQATKELQMRINHQFGIPATICTFHKLGYDILKKIGFKNYKVLENGGFIISQYFELIGKQDKKISSFFKNYFHIDDINYWVQFCYEFLKAWKTKGYMMSDFKRVKETYTDDDTSTFLTILEKISRYYENQMKINHWIDFDDMIVLASQRIHEIDLPYKYIMVDEYQDISPIRFQLIEKILKKNNAKLIAVGDDFQSIFAFAGSEIALFSDFQEKLKGKVLPITHTYRNSQELIDIAGNFVMKNKKQYKKHLKSMKRVQKPIVLKVYDDRKNISKALLVELKQCLKNVYDENTKAKIALLGRYRFEKKTILNDSDFEERDNHIIFLPHPSLQLTFLTVHSSKGLGFDEVILLNGREDMFGFPSKVKDDYLMRIVRKEDDSILLAEERRLFYVALTRTKNKVYILTPAYHPSSFILEIMNHPSIEIDDENYKLAYRKQRVCPNCGSCLKKKYHKKIYPYYCCTNKPICHFKTNSLYYRYPILPCPKCKQGQVIIVRNHKEYLLKCHQCDYQTKP